MTKWDLQQEWKTTSTLKTQSVQFSLRVDSERKEIGEIMDHLRRLEKQMEEGEIGTAIQSTYLPSYLRTNRSSVEAIPGLWSLEAGITANEKGRCQPCPSSWICSYPGFVE